MKINILYVSMMLGILLTGVLLFMLSPNIPKLMFTLVDIISFMAVVKWVDRIGSAKELIIYIIIVLIVFGLGYIFI